jgi:preprotein translocase subunit SecG
MFTYIISISAVLLVILVLIQTRGASLGAGSGSAAELHTTRRGVEKTIFQLTVLDSIVFVVSIIMSILLSV